MSTPNQSRRRAVSSSEADELRRVDSRAFKAVVDCLLAGDASRARRLVAETLGKKDPLDALTVEDEPYDGKSVPRGSGSSIDDRAYVFKTDGYVCQYCGREVAMPPVIEIVGIVLGKTFRYKVKGHNMSASDTHEAAIRLYPEADHVHAATWERPPGVASDCVHARDNLVTACIPCNGAKSNRKGWPRGSYEARADWDGLASAYGDLYARYQTRIRKLEAKEYKTPRSYHGTKRLGSRSRLDRRAEDSPGRVAGTSLGLVRRRN